MTYLNYSRPFIHSLIHSFIHSYNHSFIPTIIHSSTSIHTFIHHSLVCLTTGPQPLPRAVLHRVQSSASSFKLQYPRFSVSSSISSLRLLLRIPFTPILTSIFLWITCFRTQFLCQIWPIQLAFLHLSEVGYSSPPGLYIILLHFSHNRSNWFSPSFSSNAFQNFQHITFRGVRSVHHTQLCSKCNNLIISFLNLSPIC